jgi:hypothetical protein
MVVKFDRIVTFNAQLDIENVKEDVTPLNHVYQSLKHVLQQDRIGVQIKIVSKVEFNNATTRMKAEVGMTSILSHPP